MHRHGPKGSEGPGWSSSPPGMPERRQGGRAWELHLVGLGWEHQQTSDHGHQTQELHASQTSGAGKTAHLEEKY